MIEIRDLHKSYSTGHGRSKCQKACAVVGPSGAGKRTLSPLHFLLEKTDFRPSRAGGWPRTCPASGHALRSGSRAIGTIFQHSALLRRMTVGDRERCAPAAQPGVVHRQMEDRVAELLERVGLLHNALRLSGPAFRRPSSGWASPRAEDSALRRINVRSGSGVHAADPGPAGRRPAAELGLSVIRHPRDGRGAPRRRPRGRAFRRPGFGVRRSAHWRRTRALGRAANCCRCGHCRCRPASTALSVSYRHGAGGPGVDDTPVHRPRRASGTAGRFGGSTRRLGARPG